MPSVPCLRRPTRREGVAANELTTLHPSLTFLPVVSHDRARLFYCAVIVTSRARNGALYNSDP